MIQRSYQIKLVKSIYLFQVLQPFTSSFGTKTKQATQTLHDALAKMDNAKRRICLPPFAVAIAILLEPLCELATSALPGSPQLRDTSRYRSTIKMLSPWVQASRLLSDVRYARVLISYPREYSIMEIGLSPIASTETNRTCMALNYIATHSEKGVDKHGGLLQRTTSKRGIEVLMEKLSSNRRSSTKLGQRR